MLQTLAIRPYPIAIITAAGLCRGFPSPARQATSWDKDCWPPAPAENSWQTLRASSAYHKPNCTVGPWADEGERQGDQSLFLLQDGGNRKDG